MKSLLKFITCGSVDDGKSTLIGHMLYDAKLIFADQKQALELDSKAGSAGGEMDYSLLLDGLMAEREQGITIDVAYRYFTTKNRSFIVADTPGHEEYTRNMAVGASFASLAVVLVDVTKGVLLQTCRHIRICNLMGIKHFVFAVNKMDVIGYDETRFNEVKREISRTVSEFDVSSLKVIPVSATKGDNITEKSKNTPWYNDAVLLSHLEQVDVDDACREVGFVLPVQRVCRPNYTFRGFQGQIEAGSISVGDEITVLPGSEKAEIKSLYVGDQNVDTAELCQPVTIQLNREVDISRGSVIRKSDSEAEHLLNVGNLLSATILWTNDTPLIIGREYYVKIGTKTTLATVMQIKFKIDVNDGQHIHTETLSKNEIGLCDLSLADNVVFSTFNSLPSLGQFIFIDRITNATAACGRVEHALRRSNNLTRQKLDITREVRGQQLGQKPLTLWFTGLSGSGKSTLANEIEKRLVVMGKHTMLLDGDNIRMGINRDLGFKESDRVENIRRVSEVAKLMNDAGLVVLTSFISPYSSDRESARGIIGDAFVEIYVSTSLEVCAKRDIKGLYKKAYAGEIPNFTGVNSIYEPPKAPDIQIDTGNMTIEESVEYIMNQLADIID